MGVYSPCGLRCSRRHWPAHGRNRAATGLPEVRMASVASVFNLFRRNNGKWHEVRWRNGPRHIVMALRFAADGAPEDAPTVERLAGAEGEGAGSADDAQLVQHIQGAVAEYNRMNLCSLRVAA